MLECLEWFFRLTSASRSMFPTSARPASTICVDYGTSGAHWLRSLPWHSCTPLWCPASTTVTLSSLGLQRSSPTSCNECWTRQLVPEHVKYKLGVITCRCLYGSAPRYLAACCIPVSTTASRQHLRSAAGHQLVIPSHRLTTYGRRAFSVAGPMFWNSLPRNLRDLSHTAADFGRSLKTFLFLEY